MKITRIQVQSILGITDLDVRLEKPISLFAARNGAGKSGIKDSILMAFTQQVPRGIAIKKKADYAVLVNDGGAKAGGALITCNDDPDQAFSFNLPKGDFTGPDISDAMRVALDGQRFARMTADERRTFLFALTKRKAGAADVKERMLKAGCRADLIDEVLPMLRSGFPAASEHAAGEARSEKALWKQITNTAWGSKLADIWVAPEPAVPAGDAAALRQQVQDLDTQITTLAESLGTIKQAAAQAAEQAQRRAVLGVATRRLPELEAQLSAAVTERDEFQKKVDALRERAKGKARVGLVHDMARFIDSVKAWAEPAADTQQDLLERYEQEHGALSTAGVVDTEAQASLPDNERGLQVLVNRVTNLERDLNAARAAKSEYDNLAPADDAIDVSAELEEVNRSLNEARAQRQAVAAEADVIEKAKQALAAAGERTKKAAEHHQKVMAWLAIADQLAPAGIPAQLLAEALKPVNQQLHQASVDSGWPRVEIGADMELTVGGRLYQLESESFQWRADAMIAAVVAQVSGLKIVMLDRCDVLDVPARGELFSWLDMLVTEGDINQALLFATLTRPPAEVLETFESFWVEGGTIAGQSEQAAA